MSSSNLFHYRSTVVRVVDGDTIDVLIDLGFDISLKERIRLVGITTPESRTRDLEEKARGLAAKDFVVEWLLNEVDNCPVIETTKDKAGKFGRILGRVLTDDGVCLNDILVTEGHAVVYDGGKR